VTCRLCVWDVRAQRVRGYGCTSTDKPGDNAAAIPTPAPRTTIGTVTPIAMRAPLDKRFFG